MKKSFTLSFFVMLFFVNFSLAQNAALVITEPAGVAGSYEAQGAAFGPSSCDLSAMGTLLIGEDGTDPTSDGCEEIVNDLTGQIAIIDRGACNFSIKCYNAQQAGAIGVVICNNVDDPIITMAAGDFSDEVVIPCVMVARQDCEVFRAEAGITGRIEAVSAVDNSDDNIIWGANGEGAFTDGIGDWVVNNITCGNGATDVDMWLWTADGAVDGSCGGGQITSPSNCGGAMGFSSDGLDNLDGADCGTGGGECGAPQIGELISPVIDLTNATVPGVSLKWWQNSRQFNSTYIVSFTTDGGESWNDITVNGEYVTNDPATNELRRVFLPGAVGNEIQVKFRYEANYYYWIVDDVQIVETEANNLQVDPFYAIPNNAIVPASQVEPVYFLADVRNIGSQDQLDVNLNMTVRDASGTEVYTEDLSYGVIEAGTDDQNVPFNGSWTPPATPGVYTGTYTISAVEDDFDDSNNTQSFSLIVSDTIFSKDNGSTRFLSPAATNWDEGAPKSWGMGNVYYVPNDGVLSTVTVGVGNRNAGLVGQGIQIWLYNWVDANEDETVQEDERVRVAFTQFIFDGSGTGTPTDIEYTVPLIDFNTSELGPIDLVGGSNYILFMEYTDTDPAPDDDIDFEIVASDEFDYAAQIFMNSPEGEDQEGNQTGLGVGSPRYAPVLGLPEDGSFASGVEYGTVGFGREIVPIARMNIVDPNDVSVQILAEDNFVNVFPNPTSDRVTVELDFVNHTSNMTIAVYNTRGQEMLVQNYSNIQRETLSLNVSNFANGTYYMNIITDNGVRTKKIIVQK